MSLASYLKQPQNFLYIFASDSFINKLGATHAYVIKKKKLNQKQLLTTAAGGAGQYNAAYTKMAEAFKDMFGVTPKEALITLAKGGEVAGKDWSKGIYGVGKTKSPYFQDTPGATALIAVNPKNGVMYDMDERANAGGMYVESLGCSIYAYDSKGRPQYKYIDDKGNVYTSVYNKLTGKYEAAHYAQKDGQTYTSTGKAVTAADSSSIWEGVVLSIGKIIEWLVSLFNATNNDDKELITAANTQPSQQDGWVYNAGVSPWVLLAVGAGTLVATGGLGGWLRSSKKKSK